MSEVQNYKTLLTEINKDFITVTINRLQQKNSINDVLLTELNQLLDLIEKKEEIRFVILQGQDGDFCTGMDFEEITQYILAEQKPQFSPEHYMNTLKRFTQTSKVIIGKIDGRVLAGGMGIVAACDVVLSSARSQFGLSEALWGLLPANVMPFLIRRVGFQKAYWLTLTTQTILAQRAYEIHLVDELSDNLDTSINRLLISLRRVSETTVGELKGFFRKMWLINDEMENTAINELKKLLESPQVTTNIKNFVQEKKLPWEKT